MLRADLFETKRTTRRARALGFALAAMAAVLLCFLLTGRPAHAKTFTVNTTADPASPTTPGCDTTECTLWEAITAANATTAADTIKFNIPITDFGYGMSTPGVFTILPSVKPMPQITAPLTIDGYSQPGASPNTLAVGNDAVLKIELNGYGSGEGAIGLWIRAAKSTVKGLVINGWEQGVRIDGSGSKGNKVEGNHIGTDANGKKDQQYLSGSSLFGVVIQDAPANTIGGTKAAARNIISNNDFHGVAISGTGTTGNKVMGNYIGTEADGVEDLGNGNDGVIIFDSPGNTIGGTKPTMRNIISGNEGNGVEIGGSGATGNSVLSNSIIANSRLEIDLEGGTEDGGGRTANDTGDADTGPNGLQNFPVLSSATSSGNKTTIEGTLNSTANTKFIIQFFGSGFFSEGQKLMGRKSVTTDATGNASFAATTPAVPAGQFVTATATNRTTGDTSEFSEAVIVATE